MQEGQSMKFNLKVRLSVSCIVLFISLITNNAQTIILHVPEQFSLIQEAIDVAQNGDIIVVQAGEYQEAINIDKAITLTALDFDVNDPTNNTTFITGLDSNTTGIAIEADIVGIVTIQGFVISNADDVISLSSRAKIQHNYFHTGNDLIDTEDGGSGLILGNVFVDAGDDAIDLDDTSEDLIIKSNRIYNSHDDGIEIRLQPASAPLQPIEITIKYNQIIGNGRTGLQLIDYVDDPQNTNRRFIIANNLFAANGQAAIGFMPNEETQEDLSGANIIETVIVYNNTFYNNPFALSGGDNHIALNNIIVSGEVGASRVQGNEEDNSVVDYTLFYNLDQNTVDSIAGEHNLYGVDPQFSSLPNPGADNMWNTIDDDYSGLTLTANSPAVDAGTSQYQLWDGSIIELTDFDYTGLAPDLGWKEYEPQISNNND